MWPFSKKDEPVLGIICEPTEDQGRALVVVGTKLQYPTPAHQAPHGAIFTVVGIRFHWAINAPDEHDIVFEVEDADGHRHREVYYRFQRPTPDPADTVYGFAP